MYILAISLAQRMHVGVYAMNEVYRQYGDFLYSKGDYDTAMQQYLKAINNSEPSRVVRKVIDTEIAICSHIADQPAVFGYLTNQ